jgi:hypothetical protein
MIARQCQQAENWTADYAQEGSICAGKVEKID